MSEIEDELVNHSVYAYRPANKLQCCVVRVTKDKVISVKVSKLDSSDSAGQSRDMIDIRFLNHRCHGLLHRTCLELVTGMLIPDGFKVEEGSA